MSLPNNANSREQTSAYVTDYHQYSDMEKWYWWHVGRRRVVLSILSQYADPSRTWHVLDIGCGTGMMLKELQGYGHGFGADSCADAVTFCHMGGLRNLVQSTAESLPFADNSFHLVTVLDVLEHLADDEAALREVRRVSRTDGLILITVPAWQFLWSDLDEQIGHKRRYSSKGLSTTLARAGLEVKRMTYTNSLFFPAACAANLVRRFKSLFSDGSRPADSPFAMRRPSVTNRILTTLFSAEAVLLRKRNLPIGVSILCLARKG